MKKDPSGDDHQERGGVRAWVIVALVAAVVIAALLAIAGPPLAALFSMFLERAAR